MPASLEARERIVELRGELEQRGLGLVARAVQRLGVLTDLWECLAADQADSAGQLGLFCIRAATRLARAEPAGPEGDDVARWVLEQSSSSWGEYLSLIESPEVADDASILPDEPEAEEEFPAIDARALLSLFTGATGAVDKVGLGNHPSPGDGETSRARGALPPDRSIVGRFALGRAAGQRPTG